MSSHLTVRQTELASELLGVTSDRELTEFLGGLVTETAWRLGELPPGTRHRLVQHLQRTVAGTVPTVAALVGSGRPVDATAAARWYGLELEGMSAEDRDYEIARQFVRLAQAEIAAAAGNRLRRTT